MSEILYFNHAKQCGEWFNAFCLRPKICTKCMQEYRQPPISSSEWKSKTPVNNSPLGVSERSAFKPRLPSQAGSVSAEQQAESASKPLQLKATKACQEFLASRSGSGSGESNKEDEEEDPSEESDECDSENEEEDPSEDGGDEEEDPSEDGNDEEEDPSEDRDDEDGFVKLFMEDSELRDFYVKNYEDGEFCCLVCGGIEEMLPKSFRGCVALVQHSIATSTMNKKLAHRAYGQAICQILGWDFNIFPSIISIGESLGQTLSKLGNSQVTVSCICMCISLKSLLISYKRDLVDGAGET